MMENAEEIMHSLEEFSKLKPKVIPRELEDYLGYVAKSGDPVFKWSLVKFLFREKMLSVINDFYEDTLTIELPPCPNVDPFNYDRMKSNLLERLESFHGAPFTIQRICELLTNPRKEYNRADKFMRAIAKNVLVVSTREPGRYSELDCETTQECSINGIREVGDSLDSTFIINDLGPGPDSSSPSSDLNDSMSDTNHLTSIERVSPVHDQEISSDSDDNSLENGQISVERPPDKPNGLESEHTLSLDDNTVSNVSSTDMTLSLESNSLNGIHCDETTGSSVTSTHESMISNQQIGFAVGPSLGVMGSVEGSPVENLEPCILPDGTLLNEVINQHESDTAKVTEPSECLPQVSKSDELHTAASLIDDPDDASPKSLTETVECDTSQTDRGSKCDDGIETPNSSSVAMNEAHCDINEQVSSCDTTEASSDLVSGYDAGSVEVHTGQSEISTVTDLEQTSNDAIIQSEAMSQSALEASTDTIAQSDVIDQSDVELSNSSQREVVAQSDGISSPSSITNSDLAAQSDVVAQSDSDTNVSPDTIQSEVVAQSDEDIVAQSNVLGSSDSATHSEELAQSDLIDQSDSGLSDPVQSEVSESSISQVSATSLDVLQTEITSQSNELEETKADNSVNSVVQSCAVATSEDVSVPEPMTQSNVDDESECSVTQDQLPDQTQPEAVIQMDIPCESENMVEPVQSIQPDSGTSEPMDVDE